MVEKLTDMSIQFQDLFVFLEEWCGSAVSTDQKWDGLLTRVYQYWLDLNPGTANSAELRFMADLEHLIECSGDKK